MIRTFKLRYVNEIVGVFVLVSMGLLVAGIMAMIGGPNWFQPSRHVIIDLPPQGSLGLKPGSSVFILGSVVGQVDAITYEKGRMQADINIRGNLIELLREFSYATIDKPLGIGDPYITIERDNPDWENEPALPLTKHIPGVANAGPTEKLQQIANEVQREAIPAIQEVRAAIREYTMLAADLRDPQKPLQTTLVELKQSLADVKQITGAINKGEGFVGRILKDPKLAEQISSLMPKLNTSLDELQGILKTLGKTSDNLSQIS